jgi:hypothetical protein
MFNSSKMKGLDLTEATVHQRKVKGTVIPISLTNIHLFLKHILSLDL